MPITQNHKKPDDAAFWSAPYEEFHGAKPDCRTLFNFGSVGAFHRVRDGTDKRNEMGAQSMLGTALGQSKFANGMMFYDPGMDSFCVSADCVLDTKREQGGALPSIQHDGGFFAKFKSHESDGPTEFDAGDSVSA